MKEGIKLELYRAFHSRTYVFALVIACLIAIAQVIAEAVPLIGGYAGEADNITYPPSLYNTCLMLNFAGILWIFVLLCVDSSGNDSIWHLLLYGFTRGIYQKSVYKNEPERLSGWQVSCRVSECGKHLCNTPCFKSVPDSIIDSGINSTAGNKAVCNSGTGNVQ